MPFLTKSRVLSMNEMKKDGLAFLLEHMLGIIKEYATC